MFGLKLEPYVKVQTLIIAVLYVGQILIGFTGGWTSPTLLKLKDPDQSPLSSVISDQEASWIASMYFIGTIIGPHTVTFLSNFAGRKPCLVLAGFIYGLSFLILALAKNLTTIFIGRVLAGIAVGVLFVIHLVYIGEIASTPIRGIFLSLTAFFINIGLLIIFSMVPYLSYATTCYLGLAMSLLYIFGVLFIPETPLFLILKGNEKKAKEILGLLKREEDFQTIVSSTDNINSKTKWSEIITMKSNRRALFIIMSLLIFQQLSGCNVLISFVSIIFEMSNSSMDTNISSILVSVTQIIAGVIAIFFVERSGRRPLLLCSTAVCSLSMGLLGTYFYLDHIESPVTPSINWLPLVSFISYSMSYALGFGIIPSTFMGEMFTPGVRSAGATLTITISWIFGIAMVTAFGYLLQLGNYIAFYVFSVACAGAFVFTLVLVPETKGKSLVEVQEMLS